MKAVVNAEQVHNLKHLLVEVARLAGCDMAEDAINVKISSSQEWFRTVRGAGKSVFFFLLQETCLKV
jgi:hypothetical protein